jgi:hypothetical protein
MKTFQNIFHSTFKNRFIVSGTVRYKYNEYKDKFRFEIDYSESLFYFWIGLSRLKAFKFDKDNYTVKEWCVSTDPLEKDDITEVIFENTKPELKVGQWVKIIDEPEEGRPTHWSYNGKMDKYFGQWVQVVTVNVNESYNFIIEDGWVLEHSDYTEVSGTEVSGTNPDAISCADQRIRYVMTPEQSLKVLDLFKEETVSSHLILLDVKPVRVSKQFK